MHGDDDQIVPYPDSAPLSAKLLKNATFTATNQGLPLRRQEQVVTSGVRRWCDRRWWWVAIWRHGALRVSECCDPRPVNEIKLWALAFR